MRIVKPQNENRAWKMTTGEQIQGIASWFYGIGCFIFALAGIVQIVAGRIFVGILVTFFGILCIWISTRFIQGFGELIEDTADTCAYTRGIVDLLESQCAPEADDPPAADTDENDSDNTLVML